MYSEMASYLVVVEVYTPHPENRHIISIGLDKQKIV